MTFNGVSLFRQDAAIVSTHSDTIATLKTGGLYVVIEAGSRASALAAAEALVR